MDNSTIFLQELLDYISRLRDDVNALAVASSHLALSTPRGQMLPTLASIYFEPRNPRWSQEQQNSFRRLATLLEENHADKTTISAEFSGNQ